MFRSMRRLFLALAGCAACAAQAQWLAGLTREAQALDPAVTAAQAQLRAADERVVQARAGFGPTAALSYTNNDTRYAEAPAYDTRPFGGHQTTLQVTQPLLRTLLYPTLQGADAQLEQSAAQLEQARSESALRFLEASFEALKARDTLSLARAQRLSTEEQLASAQRSFKVGTVTVVDVRDAEAKLATVDAQILAAQADLELRAQYVAELLGRPVPELLARRFAAGELPDLPQTGVLDWLSEAQLRNPQVIAARHAFDAAEAEVRKAWTGHAPTVDLTYRYTQSSDTGTETSVFARRGNSSQVGVSINVPLFASGATQSKVREAFAMRDKAQSDVDAARRSVQVSVRQAFTSALSSSGLARGLEKAAQALEVALKANRRGYEVGMKVGVDVLEAQSKLFETRRDLSRARYDSWLNFLRLKSLSGRLQDADLDAVDRLLAVAPEDAPLTSRRRQTEPGAAP